MTWQLTTVLLRTALPALSIYGQPRSNNKHGHQLPKNIGSEVLNLKATKPLFSRLLIISRLSREIVDLEEVIGLPAPT